MHFFPFVFKQLIRQTQTNRPTDRPTVEPRSQLTKHEILSEKNRAFHTLLKNFHTLKTNDENSTIVKNVNFSFRIGRKKGAKNTYIYNLIEKYRHKKNEHIRLLSLQFKFIFSSLRLRIIFYQLLYIL